MLGRCLVLPDPNRSSSGTYPRLKINRTRARRSGDVRRSLKTMYLGLTAIASLQLCNSIALGQASAPATGFGTTSVGSAGIVQSVTFTFAGSETLESITVLAQGASGSDFTNGGGGSCTIGTAYEAGNTCSVNVSFAPTLAGTRYGAVDLNNAAGNTFAVAYLQGSGTGPQVNFFPGSEISIPTSALNAPDGVAVDGSGSVYIADSQNNRVLKETPSGGAYAETTIATSPLNNPIGLAIDGAGILYIADSGNSRILKETPTGSGFTESTVPTSPLSFPSGVAVDGSGDVYIADWGNNRVLMETLSATNYTESVIPTSTLNGPEGVTVDSIGDIYIADSGNQRILIETLNAGTYSESALSTSTLLFPSDIAIDDFGNLYIADSGNSRILKESPSGGSYTESTVATSSLSYPWAIAIGGKGNVYIADTGNERVLEEDSSDPPTLGFVPTAPNATSSDSPQIVTLTNIGTAALNIPVPSTGTNPSIAANFTLNNNAGSACPVVAAGASSGASIGAAQSCVLAVSFTPTSSGAFGGTLVVTDNALNAAAPAYTTQAIQLNGTGTGNTDQSISFEAIAAQTANTSVALSATASSGLAVSFNSTTPTICTVNGATATLIAGGTCTIAATQAGNATYAPASPVTQSFAVNPASQAISFPTIAAQILNTSVPVILSATASSGLPVTFSSTTTSVCTVSGSILTLVDTGTCGVEASQPGNATYAAATPVTQSFTVESATPQTGTNFGSVAIGISSAAQTVTFTFAGAETPGSIAVLTQGAASLDFANAATGSCATGTGYSAGNSCTVNVTFTPTAAGARYGAVVLEDGAGNPIATAYIQGLGTGPQVNFLPGSESTVLASGLSAPYGVAVDASGDVYIADTYNNRILKETFSEGAYTESTVPTSTLGWPSALATDGAGNLYIADTYNNRILKETPAGSGYSESVIATSALAYPFGVAVDGSGNVYIADTYNNRILVESPAGGSYTETVVPTSTLSSPQGVAVDGNGNIYIADTYNNRVLMEVVSSDGYSESTIPTSTLYDPAAVAVDGVGNLYIADTGNNRILREVASSGSYVESTVSTSALNAPSALWAGSAGYIYIADTGNDRVLEENLTNPPSLTFADTAPGATSADSPQTVTLWNSGNATLVLQAPAAGTNPNVAANFTVTNTGSGGCPIVSSGSSPGSLVAGQSCALAISFTPGEAGSFAGALVVTDNALNATAPSYATQNVNVSGVGTGGASQTITFAPIGTLPANSSLPLIASASSGLPVSFSSLTPAVCVVSGSMAALLTAGSCSIEAMQPGNANFSSATPVTQTFTGSPASQTISFLPIPTQIMNASVAVSLTATASSGLPVNFASTTPSICTVSGSAATLLAVGSCNILATQSGNGTFTAAPAVAQSFAVQAVSSLTATNFGSINVGAASPSELVAVTFGAAETVGNIFVLTEGTASPDFTNAGTGSCTQGTAYSAGGACTVAVVFSPLLAGARYGAVVIHDSSGNTIATQYLQGVGIAPQLDFLPGLESTVPTSTLSHPAEVTVDGGGDVYLADSNNNRVLKETLSNGEYQETTIPTSALSSPAGVAVDAGGNVYIADTGNNRILDEVLSGGGYEERTIPTSALSSPSGVAVDGSGNVYIADSGNNRILIEMPASDGYTEYTVPTSTLQQPEGVAVDAAGNIYIADTYNNRALKETLSGGAFTESIIPTSALYYPDSITVDGNGNVYIADTNNGRILKESSGSGGYTETVIPAPSLAFPSGVAVDGLNNVYVTDEYNQVVLKEDFADPPNLTFALTAPGSTSSDSPKTVALENTGNATLTLPIPSAGTNPNVPTGFTLTNGGTSGCPQINAGASSSGTLGAGQSCLLTISFAPNETGSFGGTAVITDNALNAGAPGYAVQSISLTGTGTGSTAQTITFAPIAAQTATSTVPLTATASSGLAVSFNSTTPSVCSVSGSTATLTVAGTCSIQASQPGNSQYAPASPISQSFSVSLASQTISFPTIPNQAINTAIPVTLTAASSAGLPIAYSSSTPAICQASTATATATLLASGTCTIEASQSGNSTFAAASSVSQSFSVEQPTPLTSTVFGSVNIGSTSAAKTITVTIAGADTLGNISVLTEGVSSLDFANAGTGTCASGSSYSAGNTCTVVITFAPTLPGVRYGAVALYDTSGNPLAVAYLQGTGGGPELNFLPGTETAIPTSNLSDPGQIAIDGSGSVYIADTQNNRILKETLAAGSYSESVIPTSSLSDPAGVAVDASGNIYIADTYNNRVLKETLSPYGYNESTIPTSALSTPSAVAVDGSGNVYVADTGNNRILLEAWTGTGYNETTVPTSGLQYPGGIAVDASGTVYIADSGNNRVLKESLSTGTYSEVMVTTSALNSPEAVAVDAAGNIYISDSGNNRVLKETVLNGGYNESVVSTSSLNFPGGVVIGGSGNIYIADTYNQRVIEEDLVDPPSLSFATTAPGSVSSDSPQTVILQNSGNAGLTFPVPPAGTNPGITANFSLSTAGAACPEIEAGFTSPGMLSAGQSCVLGVSFVPTSAGSLNGAVSVSDNSLNASGPGYATQTIQMSGTGAGTTQQTITFGAIGNQTANSTIPLTATASSGLTVGFASSTSAVCSVSGTAATLLGAGTCTIEASQPGNSQFAPATPVTQSFTVSLAAQTISFATIPNQVINASIPVVLSASATSGLPITFTSTTPAVCTASTANATTTLLTTGSCSIVAAQPGDGVVYGAATPVTQSFTVESATPQTGTNFGSVAIGASSTAQTVTFTFAGAETPGSISVLTQGAAGLDFANTGTGSCTTETGYSAGNSCTVNVTFTPTAAGVRYGAVVLQDGSGNPIATDYVQGLGTGPQVNFLPGTESTVLASGLSAPAQIAVDGAGNVYIVDTYNNRVLKESVSSDSYTESTIPTSSLNFPAGVAVDAAGNLYIADSGNDRILMESPMGTGYVESTIPTSTLNWPSGVAVDGGGDVYVADTYNNRVLIEMLSGGAYTEITVPTTSLSSPSGITVDGNGNIYIADSGNNRVLKELLSGGAFSEVTIATSSLNSPKAVATDGRGDVYISDAGNNRVLREIVAGGGYIENVIPTSSLSFPQGVAVDSAGNVYVSDTYNSRILKEDLSDPPSLSFALTIPGQTSPDSPQTITLQNLGDTVLSFPVPASGENPIISTNFSLNTAGLGSCPTVTAGSPSAGTLPAGQSCQLPISFAPTGSGSFSGTLAVTDTALNAAAPGYAVQSIQLSGVGNGNTSQTISFGGISAQSANSNVSLTASASSGLAVSFSSTTPGICTVSGATASLLAAGNCTIVASQSGNAQYAPAPPVSQTFTVTLAPQTISFSSIPAQIVNASVALSAWATSGLAVDFTSTTPSVCTASTANANATLLTAGTCTVEATQPGDGVVYAAAQPVTQSFTVESVSSQASANFGSVDVGTASPSQSVTFTFSASETLGTISAVTQGVTGLDYANSGSGTCAVGTAYNAGDSCTVSVTFTPAEAGVRYGAVVLLDNSGNPIATSFVQGIGVGPEIDFLPGNETAIPASGISAPYGVAVDAGGNVYIADTEGNQVVKEALSSGSYTQTAIPTSGLSGPAGIAVDGSGAIYIADSHNNRVLKETPAGTGYVQTTVPTSSLFLPTGVAVDGAGNVYIADSLNGRVLVETLTSSGYSEITIPTGYIWKPEGVAVDGSGNVYIAVSGEGRILKEAFSGGGYSQSIIASSGLNNPEAVGVDFAGNVYVADSGNNRILRFSAGEYGETTVSTSTLSAPSGVTADSLGNLYIADDGNDRVLQENYVNPPALSFATTAPGATSSDSPQTVTLENLGNAPLDFPIPASGTNPSIAANFALASGAEGDCPLATAGSSWSGSLGPGESCSFPVSFTPTTTGAISGSVNLNDNALNAPPPAYTTQAIQLSGTGSGNQQNSGIRPLEACGPANTGVIPTITSISPSGWFPGETNLKVIVTGNLTGNDTIPGCDYTEDWISPLNPSSSTQGVQILSATVLNANQIALTVDVAQNALPGLYQLQMHCDGCDYSAYATVPVLPLPQIQNKDDNDAVISGLSFPIGVFVGDRVQLTTNLSPNSTDAVQLPAGVTLVSNQWDISPTNIGGYNPTAGATFPSVTTTTNPDILFYWVYPGNNLHASYSYCALVAVASNGGEVCSRQVTALFNVEGVSDANINPSNTQAMSITPVLPCKGQPQEWMLYGSFFPDVDSCEQNGDLGLLGVPGITFNYTGTPPDSGQFFFDQVIVSSVVTFAASGNIPFCSHSSTGGLDGGTPYGPYNEPAKDAPGIELASMYSLGNMTFHAKMYLLWQDDAGFEQGDTSSSIPVPLGYVDWTFDGTARQAVPGTWSYDPYGSPNPFNTDAPTSASGNFVPSSGNQPFSGFPTWQGLSTEQGGNCIPNVPGS
jgi:DNA-binding beta-propeller fold protein YncE